MKKYYQSEYGNRIIEVDGDRVTEFSILFTVGDDKPLVTEEVVKLEPADPSPRRKYNKKPKHERSTGQQIAEEHGENLKLVQEYGLSAVNAVVKAKNNGHDAITVLADRPYGTSGLTLGDVEKIMDNYVQQ